MLSDSAVCYDYGLKLRNNWRNTNTPPPPSGAAPPEAMVQSLSEAHLAMVESSECVKNPLPQTYLGSSTVALSPLEYGPAA